MKRSKAYNNAKAMVDGNKKYSPLEACELAKKTTLVKYDATIRASFKLNVDPRQADQQIRGAIVLPNGTGRSQKVLVVTQGANMEVAKNAGADYVGDKEILEKVKGGWFDYDVIVATPDMMGELGKLGKILGPKGLMPNPKTGTVTPNSVKAGKITTAQLREIAEYKMPDLNANDVEAAMRIIAGTARNMGIEVVD